jgi:hypothetical protein
MQSTHASPRSDRVRIARAHGVNVAPSLRVSRPAQQIEPTSLEFPNVAATPAGRS